MVEEKKLKVLCTGGAGFIGSHVAKDLLKKGYEVVIIDDLSGGFEENIPEGAKFVKKSIEDYPFLEKLFEKEKFDYVFHLAAYAAEGLSHFIRRYNYSNNLMGSINLINLSVLHKIKCFVFTSSMAVYGKNQVPMVEDMIPQPIDPYGIAKYAVEQDLKTAKELFDLNYIIIRPHNVYGENQNIGDKYRNVIGIFMNQIMQGEPLTIFGDGTQTRAYSYISDVSSVIAESIRFKSAYNEIFNVGADHPYTILDIITVISKEFGVAPDIKYFPERHEVKHAYTNQEKATFIFDMKAEVGLEEGIKRMADWARKHGARKTAKFANIEIEENLPPSWRDQVY